MSEFITKIRTSEGDKQIDYNALANKPQFKMPSVGADGTILTDATTGYDAITTEGVHIGTLTINNEEKNLYAPQAFTLETDSSKNNIYKPVLSENDGWKYVVSSNNEEVMWLGNDNVNAGALRLSSSLAGHGDLYQTNTNSDIKHYLPSTGGTLLNDKSVLAIENGGTNATTVKGALTNLGLTGITTTGSANSYIATVPGITELVVGTNFIMIPHANSSSDPTLNVNGLGAKEVKRYVSSRTGAFTRGCSGIWLSAGQPVRVMYNGACWIVENLTFTTLQDINDSDHTTKLSIAKGGTNASTKEEACKNLGVVDLIYPVGSIYISVNETSPATLFGVGTWEQIKDTFLLSAGDTYAAGSTGGAATHTLTVDEMPAHSHYAGNNAEGSTETLAQRFNTAAGLGSSTISRKEFAESSSGGLWVLAQTNDKYDNLAQTLTTAETGGGLAHNNMPPYLSVYMWKRVS